MKKLIAVITPTYNREKLLSNLYESLVNQTSHNFKWYIIDDGSIDNTSKLCKSFINENKIDIKYVLKKNGGKHTAINEAMKYVKEELSFIVDSDDELTPNAIEIIEKDYKDVETIDEICGLGYLKIDKKTNNPVGRCYSQDGLIDNFVNERINRNIYGDKAEVYKTKILRDYPFPTIEGEKFMSESVVWCNISKKYKLKFFNKGIYVCEYQQDGLSATIHKTLFNNPKGAAECYLQMASKQTNLKYRLKYTIAFSVYSYVSKIKLAEQFKRISSKFLLCCTFGISYLIYLSKKRKYKK